MFALTKTTKVKIDKIIRKHRNICVIDYLKVKPTLKYILSIFEVSSKPTIMYVN